MSKVIEPKIFIIRELLEQNLSIPSYQRPYRWSERHITDLISDIYNCFKHPETDRYRIGTIVLHQESENCQCDIVDGQQRTITLCLLLLSINKLIDNNMEAKLFKNLQVLHPESKKVLKHNSVFIMQFIRKYSDYELQELREFILNHCSVVIIKLTVLSEAFQFFDSQNARGKALEPHDLLKAYHLREMRNHTEESKLNAITQWEKEAVGNGQLKTLFNEFLYRLRQWNKNCSGRYFIKSEVDVFKGVNLDSDELPKYLQLSLRAYLFNKSYNQSSDRLIDNNKLDFPHQINQVILNGALFFDYVQFYCEQLSEIRGKSLFLNDLENYKGCDRSGDIYTRNLFLAALLLFHDRFGDKKLKEAEKVCFEWAYKLRLEQSRVGIASVDNYALSDSSLLKVIENATYEKEVLAVVVNKNKQKVEQNGTRGLSALKKRYLGKVDE
ncbi:DUF262 domain-containing protein [Pseudoalteromonas sp. SS15]|uniref:DUF262 domain-containing protein n=1 Tax=Pseudoalteromonas sp. SS15 TaxID=3139393 RepID=UPI003BA9A668